MTLTPKQSQAIRDAENRINTAYQDVAGSDEFSSAFLQWYLQYSSTQTIAKLGPTPFTDDDVEIMSRDMAVDAAQFVATQTFIAGAAKESLVRDYKIAAQISRGSRRSDFPGVVVGAGFVMAVMGLALAL